MAYTDDWWEPLDDDLYRQAVPIVAKDLAYFATTIVLGTTLFVFIANLSTGTLPF